MPPSPPRSSCADGPFFFRAGAILLVLVLVALVPLFVCMPLWIDTVQYDIHARNYLRGGVPYEDSSDSNLPGIQWIQTALRAAIGWGSMSIRIVDLIVVAGIAWMLLTWMPTQDRTRKVWTLVSISVCYLLAPEVVHCQRDVWMLALALAALAMRYRQFEGLARGWSGFALSILEGAIWGMCVWIKPHALMIAASVYAVSVSRRLGRTTGRQLITDALGLVIGGAVVGAAGIAWLWTSGAWNHFWEVLLVWSKDYVGTQKPFPSDLVRFWHWTHAANPWSLVPWVAVGAAALALAWPSRPGAFHPLYNVMLLVWFVQGFFIQAPHEYVLMPILLMSIPVLWSLPILDRRLQGLCIAGVLSALTFAPSGLVTRTKHFDFVPTWLACWKDGATPEIRDRLAVFRYERHTNWTHLEEVADYLRSQGVSDGELTCFHSGTHSLFLMLDVKPSIKHIQPNVALEYFPSHLEEIRQELSDSKQRFVVSDLHWIDIPHYVFRTNPTTPELPAEFMKEKYADERSLFPWCEPVVFRAGPYFVHRITGPTARFWPETLVNRAVAQLK